MQSGYYYWCLTTLSLGMLRIQCTHAQAIAHVILKFIFSGYRKYKYMACCAFDIDYIFPALLICAAASNRVKAAAEHHGQ